MNEIYIDEELIVFNTGVSEQARMITYLSGLLEQKGLVKATFRDAVLQRERVYPTGLQLNELNIALPHTDPTHVYASALAVARLTHPVRFYRMDNPRECIPVRLVLVLAIHDPHDHIQFLQRLVEGLNRNHVCEALMNAVQVNDFLNVITGVWKSDDVHIKRRKGE
jgi:PTS system galactitol-specific IIA component